MWPAGHIQREVAVAVVIAVEETPLLPAVQRVVGRVHIQDDLLRRRGVAVQEQLHQQRVEPLRVGHDALVAVLRGLLGGAQLEPVEGARAGQRMAPVALPQTAFAAEVVAAQGERQQAVVAQPVVVAEVLIPQRQPEQALGQQALQGMLAAAGVCGDRRSRRPGAGSGRCAGRQPAAAGRHHRRTCGRRQSERALGGGPDWPDRL